MRKILFCYLFLSLFPQLAFAQITLDNSLRSESSVVESTRNIVNTSQLKIQHICQQTADSKFVNIGKGGLPENPNYALDINSIQVELVSPIPQSEKVPSNEKNLEITLGIVQEETRKPAAQGWIVQENSLVELVAFNPDRLGEQRHFSDRNNCW